MNNLNLQAVARMSGIVVLLALNASGQISTSTVTGTVTDATHAVVAGTQIQVQNENTGLFRTVVSNAEGQYTVAFLPPGIYRVSATAAGFERFDQNDLALLAGQTVRVDVDLKVDSSTQSVTVSGQSPLLHPETSDQIDTVTTTQLRELPQAKLDWTNVLNIEPGIYKKTQTGGTNSYVLNGLAANSLKLTVDGTDASSDAEQPSLGFYQSPNVINVLNTDAISEVSVLKGIAPASVGGTMSGNVNLITKSGANQFHGDIYEINSLSAYNARNQFVAAKLPYTFNQYGGALGGRIVKDRLFFFGSYEGVRSSQFVRLTADAPTPYLLSISPAAYQTYLAAFPKVPQPGNDPQALTAGYSGSGSQVQHDGNTTERFDYYLSSGNMLTFRYTRSTPLNDIPNVVEVNGRTFDATDSQYNLNFVHSGARYTSSSRIGINRMFFKRIDNGFAAGLQELTFNNIDDGGSEWYQLTGNTSNYLEDFTINRGRHVLQFGGVIQRLDTSRIDRNTAGPISYSNLTDYLNNIPSGISITFDVPHVVLHTYQFGAYLQDDYKISSNLTLNLGVRYDYFTVPKEANGLVFNRGIDPANPQWGDGFGPFRPPGSIYNADYNNLQPRAGFAWSLGSSRRTVVRGGFGTMVGVHAMYAAVVGELQAGPNIPFRIDINRAQGITAGLAFPLPGNDFLPILSRLQSSGAISITVPSNKAIHPDYPNPYSMQWMLEAERQLGAGVALSVGYVANTGKNLDAALGENAADRLTGIAPNPVFPSFALEAALDSSRYDALQVRLNKRFSRRLGLGAFYTYSRNTAYCNGDVVNSCVTQNLNTINPVNISSIKPEHGPTDNDIAHNFNATFLYELPFERWTAMNGRRAKAILGGWQISGILSARSGLPVNITSGNSGNDRPDRVSGPPAVLGNYRSTLLYLNKPAFSPPGIVRASGRQAAPGTLGRNALNAPGMWNLDSSLAKSVFVTEGLRLQLRGDFFNAFNHTNLAGLTVKLNSGRFGQLTSAIARTAQIGARLEF